MKKIRLSWSYAIYRGREYRCDTSDSKEGWIGLVSHDPADEKHGFVSYEGRRDLFTMDVPKTEIEEGYDIYTVGIYRDIKVVVYNSHREGYHTIIPYNNNDAWIAEIPSVEPNHYEMDVPAEEVTELHEIRRPAYGLPFKG